MHIVLSSSIMSLTFRKAYHRLVLPDGQLVEHPVVVFDEKGRVVCWHRMTQEEPFTEWVGGEYRVQAQDMVSYKKE